MATRAESRPSADSYRTSSACPAVPTGAGERPALSLSCPYASRRTG